MRDRVRLVGFIVIGFVVPATLIVTMFLVHARNPSNHWSLVVLSALCIVCGALARILRPRRPSGSLAREAQRT